MWSPEWEETKLATILRSILARRLIVGLVSTVMVSGLLIGTELARTDTMAKATSLSNWEYSYPSSTSNLFLEDLTGTQYNWTVVAPRYHVIVLNSYEYSWIPAIKAANPDVQVWEYKDLTSTRINECTNGVDNTFLTTGIGYCYAMKYHPEWFLHTSSGSLLQEYGYPNQYEMDYGNSQYVYQWAENVVNDVLKHGWDGVEMDNAVDTANAYGLATKYPTDQSVQVAMTAMLTFVGKALRYYHINGAANVGYQMEFPGLWQRWISLVPGLHEEFFMSWSDSENVTGIPAWEAYMEELNSTTSAPQNGMVILHAGSYAATNTQLLDYTYASFLLGEDGVSDFAFGTETPDYPEFHLNLGSPEGKYFENSNGTFQRNFTNGYVVVDPNAGTGKFYVY